MPSRPRLAGALLALHLSIGPHPAPAQQWRTGKIADTYAQFCASCHGPNLQGGQAPSMLDDEWNHGSDDESIARVIRQGLPEKGMPAWGALLPEKEIRAMVIFLREQQARHRLGQLRLPAPPDSLTVEGELHAWALETWVDELAEPWSLAFLDADHAIVTEKRGQAFVLERGRRRAEPISGLPSVETAGQAGLFDVVPHPEFARNGWIYFAFAERHEGASLTTVIRGKLRGNRLESVETIYRAPPELFIPITARVHWGGRLAFDRAGYLYLTMGERGQRDHAQDLGRPNGKVHRLHDDGRIPTDNPFAGRPGALPTIWSYGHRNPQGLAVHPETGALFDLEHGPRGGDELNDVRRGANYGWPVITYGMEYSGAAITDRTHQAGMEQPVTYWVPSLGVCGINFYTGDLFPRWKNHLFLASLSAEELRRLELRDGRVVAQETLFKGLGRIRHVIGGPDGALYVLLPKRIVRIAPPAAASGEVPAQ